MNPIGPEAEADPEMGRERWTDLELECLGVFARRGCVAHFRRVGRRALLPVASAQCAGRGHGKVLGRHSWNVSCDAAPRDRPQGGGLERGSRCSGWALIASRSEAGVRYEYGSANFGKGGRRGSEPATKGTAFACGTSAVQHRVRYVRSRASEVGSAGSIVKEQAGARDRHAPLSIWSLHISKRRGIRKKTSGLPAPTPGRTSAHRMGRGLPKIVPHVSRLYP